MKSQITPGQASSEIVPANQNTAIAAPADRINYDDPGRDQIMPRLGLVNATGKLAKKFRENYGQFVFEDRLVLGKEITAIAVKLQKYYTECRRNGVDLKFEDEKKNFATASDAHAAGYAIDFDSNHPNKAEEVASILLLVAGPKDDAGGAFFIEAGGLTFAPALMSVRRGGYRDVYRKMYTHETRAALRGGKVYDTTWTLTPETVSSTKNDNEWSTLR